MSYSEYLRKITSGCLLTASSQFCLLYVLVVFDVAIVPLATLHWNVGNPWHWWYTHKNYNATRNSQPQINALY